MRLEAIQTLVRDEIEATRPVKGDTVTYGEELFIVDEVGMRYIVAHSPDNPRVMRWFKHQELCRWSPPSPDEMEDHEMRTPLIKRQS